MRRTSGLAALASAAALTLCACGSGEDAATRLPAPSGVSVQAGSATSVHVMWGSSPGGPEISSYQVYRGGTRVKDVAVGQNMVDITGLRPSTAYTFTVRARDTAGNLSPHSRERPVTTPAAVAEDHRAPAAPSGLSATSEGPRAAHLSWRAPTGDEGITSYDIHQGDAKIHSVAGATTTARITRLRPGTRYRFTVTARDAADNTSPASRTVEITTPDGPGDDPDTTPLDFRAASHPADGGHYLDLSWLPPKTGKDAPSYQIYLDGKFATTLIWGSETPQGRAAYSVYAGKQDRATYRVKIRAELPDGDWGRFSPERTVVISPGRP